MASIRPQSWMMSFTCTTKVNFCGNKSLLCTSSSAYLVKWIKANILESRESTIQSISEPKLPVCWFSVNKSSWSCTILEGRWSTQASPLCGTWAISFPAYIWLTYYSLTKNLYCYIGNFPGQCSNYSVTACNSDPSGYCKGSPSHTHTSFTIYCVGIGSNLGPGSLTPFLSLPHTAPWLITLSWWHQHHITSDSNLILYYAKLNNEYNAHPKRV